MKIMVEQQRTHLYMLIVRSFTKIDGHFCYMITRPHYQVIVARSFKFNRIKIKVRRGERKMT